MSTLDDVHQLAIEMTPRELYEALARCIASVPEEYRAELCREFRINPAHLPKQEPKS